MIKHRFGIEDSLPIKETVFFMRLDDERSRLVDDEMMFPLMVHNSLNDVSSIPMVDGVYPADSLWWDLDKQVLRKTVKIVSEKVYDKLLADIIAKEELAIAGLADEGLVACRAIWDATHDSLSKDGLSETSIILLIGERP